MKIDKRIAATRDRSGFTLLEAVVALFIIGIAAIAALEAVGGELRSHEKVQRSLEAESLADYQLARTQMLFYEDFVAFPDSLERGRFDAPFDAYSFTTTVVPVVNEENLFKVDLVVTWQGGSYDLNTMIYRRPQVLAINGGAAGGAQGREGGQGRAGGQGRDAGGAGNRGDGPRGGGPAAPGRGRASGPGNRAGTTAGRGSTTSGGVITRTPPDTGGTTRTP